MGQGGKRGDLIGSCEFIEPDFVKARGGGDCVCALGLYF
jgi:hypothetical protein